MVSVVGEGAEAPADWASLESGETYVGWARGGSPRPSGPTQTLRVMYTIPDELRLGRWALAGNWTMGREAIHSNEAGVRITMRFDARDLHLVMGMAGGASPEFEVSDRRRATRRRPRGRRRRPSGCGVETLHRGFRWVLVRPNSSDVDCAITAPDAQIG